MQIEKMLQNCIDSSEDLGEFIVKGHKIRVFRNEDTGSVCAFVDTDYWTKWIYFDDDRPTKNLKDCMSDILEYLIEAVYNNEVLVEFIADLYMNEIPLNNKEIAADLTQFLKDEFNREHFTFKINHRDEVVMVKFDADYFILLHYVLNDCSHLQRETFHNASMTVVDPDLKKFIETAFKFKVTW